MSRPFDFFDYRDAVFASKLSRPAIATAFALTKWADVETGKFYPRQDTISEYCGIPISTLRRHLREMEAEGLLRTETTQMGNNRIWSKNEYCLVVPDLRSSMGAGSPDLRSPMSADEAKSTRPPLTGEPTSAHSWPDLRSPMSDMNNPENKPENKLSSGQAISSPASLVSNRELSIEDFDSTRKRLEDEGIHLDERGERRLKQDFLRLRKFTYEEVRQEYQTHLDFMAEIHTSAKKSRAKVAS